ncbi:MAG TPA: CaiB/BaiF CoA-transferase family protein [Candidatus Binataceae bacterium]|nr:CaiB/BaiF CoA-transferase family protein [Candidatus Binataceae bacterium]
MGIDDRTSLGSSLKDLVLLEIGNELGDYAAMLVAGFGAEVIKLEPPEGAQSRRIGPFAELSPDKTRFASDKNSREEQSVFFWRYNLNKKSAVLDVDHPAARPLLARLAAKGDIVLISGEIDSVERRLESWRAFAHQNPSLIICAITPFGLSGPYRGLKSTDLTQMAMGGIMAVCGYDPDSELKYDTPPIAPAMWHAYHIAGEYAAISIMAALNYRDLSGEGQFIDVSVHEAVNTCTEIAIPTYVYNGQMVLRQTARHAFPNITQFRLSKSSDDVYMLASLSPFEREARAFAALADQVGMEHVLNTPEYKQLEKEDSRAAYTYRNDLIEQLVARMPAQEVFERAQALGLAWSPIRRPEDNLADPHFNTRQTFARVYHPELDRDLLYPGTVAGDGEQPHMNYTRRAPTLGEHTDEIMQWAGCSSDEIKELRKLGVVPR